MRSFKYFVVHHSASPLKTTVADIRAWHTDPKPRGNGWSDIGYHRIITANGKRHAGRPVGRGGAHVRGLNGQCYAVCLTGNNLKLRSEWTGYQWAALRELWEAAQIIFPGIILCGHRDLVRPGSTECPGLDIRAPLIRPSRLTMKQEIERYAV